MSPAPKGTSPPAPTSASFRPNAPTWPGCSAITARSWRRRWPPLAACPHPVLARIEGVCVGGGLEIAAQCDLRIAAESARFGVPIGKLGFPMAPDEMRGLLDLVGRAATLAILLEGRVFDAAEALRLGLVTRTVPAAELDQAVQRSVAAILGGAPLAARINKRQARRLCAGAPLGEDEYLDFFSYAESRDHREGVRAFLAGTAPTFTGD
ncbi:enoyl-CoA hydratase/isomerase domain protein [Bordetella bronchiseptica OSU553]|nr:enoyl-CoA hydratase/isomerase domain protein [Bordetella bronchiseptica OSU553]